MKRITSLILSIILAAGAVTANAAYEAYITIRGVKQGKFKGSGASKSNRIPTTSVHFAIVSPRDPQSGLPTGQRMHKPLVMTFQMSDVNEMRAALASGELLPAVRVEFVRAQPDGKLEQYMTYELQNAHITAYKAHPSGGGKQGTAEITFTYEKFTEQRVTGKTMAADDWTQ